MTDEHRRSRYRIAYTRAVPQGCWVVVSRNPLATGARLGCCRSSCSSCRPSSWPGSEAHSSGEGPTQTTGGQQACAPLRPGRSKPGHLRAGIPPKSTVPDLLGTSLPSVPAEVIASALPQVEPVDPRLSDASADMLGDFSGFVPAPEPASAGTDLVSSLDGQPVLHTPAAGAEPAASAMTVAAAVPAPESTPPAEAHRPPAGPDNTELLQRLQRMELLLAQLQKQLEQQAAATVLSAPAEARVVGPVPAARPKPAPVQKVAKATTPKAPAAPKASQPVKAAPVQVAKQPTAPAPKLSGQQVSVDMWNGQPSVVVASGIAGDRRVRVLRPGDVINGLALRSADPVTQSATFAVPGSAGLTLYVSQGG